MNPIWILNWKGAVPLNLFRVDLYVRTAYIPKCEATCKNVASFFPLSLELETQCDQSMKQIYERGHWLVEYELNNGARISRLCYQGFDLLTTAPDHFTPPATDYGKYETRPVYGFDDCFPSVEVCKYPGLEWIVPDHGELCWLEWNAEIQSDKIIFSVESEALPLLFKRTLYFQEEQLTWHFEVKNVGTQVLPFQHVIHPLIKLTEIKDLWFPNFVSLNNEAGEVFDLKSSKALSDFLLSRNKGETHMLYLKSPEESYIQWTAQYYN